MLAIIHLVWNAVLGPWRRAFFVSLAAAAALALLAPALGWSSAAGLGVAFVVVFVAAFVTGMAPGLLGSRLINKGAALSKSGRYDDAVASFDAYLARYSKDRLNPSRVATAMLWKGVTLEKSRHPSQALAVFDDVLRRFPKADDRRSEARTASVLLHKARTLNELGRVEEAAVVYDDLIARFPGSSVRSVREVVEAAKGERGKFSSAVSPGAV
jgi:TolA-binding protein